MNLDYVMLTDAADEANLTIKWIHGLHTYMSLYRDEEFIMAIVFFPYEKSDKRYEPCTWGDHPKLNLEEICELIKLLRSPIPEQAFWAPIKEVIKKIFCRP
jgi:hypothetical protein